MKIEEVTIRNFRSFGPEPVTVRFTGRTGLIGANGSGKSSLLMALARMFGATSAERKLKPGDVHVPRGKRVDAKCMVVDDKRSFVTSANFTDRGQSRNLEVGVLVEDRATRGTLATARERGAREEVRGMSQFAPLETKKNSSTERRSSSMLEIDRYAAGVRDRLFANGAS